MNKNDMTPIVNRIAENTALIESIKETLVKQTFTIPVELKHKNI